MVSLAVCFLPYSTDWLTGNIAYPPLGRAENPLLLSNVPFQGMSGFVNEGLALNELNSNELALLQHQTQMQQLQLLQQMQGNSARQDWHGFDQNYGNQDSRLYGQAHNLMPSADIMQTDIYPFDSVLAQAHTAGHAIGHGRKVSASKGPSHANSYCKGLSSAFSPGVDQYSGVHIEDDFAAHQHALGVATDPVPVSCALLVNGD